MNATPGFQKIQSVCGCDSWCHQDNLCANIPFTSLSSDHVLTVSVVQLYTYSKLELAPVHLWSVSTKVRWNAVHCVPGHVEISISNMMSPSREDKDKDKRQLLTQLQDPQHLPSPSWGLFHQSLNPSTSHVISQDLRNRISNPRGWQTQHCPKTDLLRCPQIWDLYKSQNPGRCLATCANPPH